MIDRTRVACICFAGIFVAWTDLVTISRYLSSYRFPGDWVVLWAAGKAVNPYIDPLFAYPPTALLWLRPISEFPFADSLIAWSALGSLALYLAASKLSGRWAAAISIVAPAWVVSAISGQMSLFVGALTISGLLARNVWLAGFCFALAGTMKPQTLVALPIALIASGNWRLIAITAVCAFALVATSVSLWDVDSWLAWVEALPHFRSVLAEMGLDKVGVGANGLALRLGLPPFVYWFGVMLGVSCAWLSWRSHDLADRYVGLICASALISPYMLHYDLAGLAAPAIAILLDKRKLFLMWIGAALAISFVLAPIGIVLLATVLSVRAITVPASRPSVTDRAALRPETDSGRVG